MKHIIQRRYSYIPYPFRPDNPEKPGNVRRNGCCLCSACMIVDQLTTKEFPVKDAVKLALEVGANHATGSTRIHRMIRVALSSLPTGLGIIAHHPVACASSPFSWARQWP